MMDHHSSIRTQAAERYILGELSPSEREAFEQHFFECSECAEEVRLGFQFADNAKAEFRDDPTLGRSTRSSKSDWFAWLWHKSMIPVAACLALAGLSLYQNAVQIPRLRVRVGGMDNPVLLSPVVLAPASRAEIPSIAIPRNAQFVPLTLASGAARPGERYECRLESATGTTLWSLPVSINPDASLTILVPTSGMVSGRYDAVLIPPGTPSPAAVEHYRFTIRRE